MFRILYLKLLVIKKLQNLDWKTSEYDRTFIFVASFINDSNVAPDVKLNLTRNFLLLYSTVLLEKRQWWTSTTVDVNKH